MTADNELLATMRRLVAYLREVEVFLHEIEATREMNPVRCEMMIALGDAAIHNSEAN